MSRFKRPLVPFGGDLASAISQASGGELAPESVRELARLPVPAIERPSVPVINRPPTPEARKRKSEEQLASERAARKSRAARALLMLAIASSPPRPTVARVMFLGKVQDRPGCETFAPRSFGPETFALATKIAADTSGLLTAAILAELPERFRRAIATAALGTALRDGEWTTIRTLRSHVARRRVALAIIVWRLAESTRRKGFAARLEGFARGTWGALFPCPLTGEILSTRTLDEDWRALRVAGAIHVEQPPAHKAPRAYVGRDRDGRRRALAVYYVPRRVLGRVRKTDDPAEHERAEAVAELLRLDVAAGYARTRFQRRRRARAPTPLPEAA